MSYVEIKESSPVSTSGYYTISNGNGGSAVLYRRENTIEYSILIHPNGAQ